MYLQTIYNLSVFYQSFSHMKKIIVYQMSLMQCSHHHLQVCVTNEGIATTMSNYNL